MKTTIQITVLLLAATCAFSQPRRVVPLGSGGKRVALVIGNDRYRSLPALTNGVRDAQEMEKVLKESGFDVTLLTDASRETLEEGVNSFIAKIQPGDVALFYYSGHAVQIAGDNYLSPVDLVAANEIQARSRSLKAGEVLEQMEGRNSDLQIVILDACRNNPFSKERSIGGSGGLAPINAGKGTFLAYATAPGRTADDNSTGRNGLYTGHLVEVLRQPGLTLEQAFKRVGGDVQRASKGRQVPWISYSVDGDFYFRPGSVDRPTNTCGDAWSMVKDTSDGTSLKAFTQDFAECTSEVRLAKLRLTTLERRTDPPVQVTTGPQTNPKDGLKYVWIAPGTFQMGCSPGDKECDDTDEKPVHDVQISKGFFLGQTEVTQTAFQRVTGKNPSNFKGANLPVEQVTWDEASGYCTAIGGRLPREAEWEYAARGGSNTARYGDLDAIAWHTNNSGNKTHEVGKKAPNEFGLYDMLGNVWEWTADWYDKGYYPKSPKTDPKGPSTGTQRSLRGGGWYNDPIFVRSSSRFSLAPGVRYVSLGFRCVWEKSFP